MWRHPSLPLEGSVDGWSGGVDLPEVILGVSDSGKSGRLEVTTWDGERNLYLDQGRIVFASSSSPDDRLGVYLLGRNELSLAALRRLSPRVQPGVRLGTLLVQQGLLRPEQLVAAVSGQVRNIVVAPFRSPQASYRFVEQAPPSDEPIQVRVPTARLVMDGIEAVESWRRVLRALGSLDTRYSIVAGNEERIRELDLDTGSLELLALLSHPKTVEEMCDVSELPDIAVCRRLWVFRLLGFVQTGSTPQEDSTATLDMDLEALGLILNRGASPPEESRGG